MHFVGTYLSRIADGGCSGETCDFLNSRGVFGVLFPFPM
jgi:hypothetical protein